MLSHAGTLSLGPAARIPASRLTEALRLSKVGETSRQPDALRGASSIGREAPAIAGIGIFLTKDSYNRTPEASSEDDAPTNRPLHYRPCWGLWDPDEGLYFAGRLAGCPQSAHPAEWRYGPAAASRFHKPLPPTLETDAAVASSRQRSAAAISEVIPRITGTSIVPQFWNRIHAPQSGGFLFFSTVAEPLPLGDRTAI